MLSSPLTAGDLCTRTTVTATRTLPLTEAARLMREHHVGSLVVADDTLIGNLPVGMLTDRDIVTAVLAKDVDPHMLQVGDVMSADPVTVHESAALLDTLEAMQSRGVRRIPVVDARGALQGVLSLDDVAEAIGEQIAALVRTLTVGRQREAERRS